MDEMWKLWLSGVWLGCKCHHFPSRTWALKQSSLFQTFSNWPIYIFGHTSGVICQLTWTRFPFFFFSVSRILQKCFPNPSVPLSILVIISRRPHVSADCHFPDIPPGPYFVESPRKELFSHSVRKPRLGRPGTAVELTKLFFLMNHIDSMLCF